MSDFIDPVNDWNVLKDSEKEYPVPIALFVLCKTIVEDGEGALFFNGTAVRRVLLRKADVPDAHSKVKKELVFNIKVKGPAAGDHLTSRRKGAKDLEPGIVLGSETLDIVSAPLDVQQPWNWFPFRILKATIDFELQAKNHAFVDGAEEVMLCPNLLINNDQDKVARVQVKGALCRSNRLTFVKEEPIIKFIEDKRLSDRLEPDKREENMKKIKDGDGKSIPAEDLFSTYPQVRLEFYLHEPLVRAMFKIVGPLFLVGVLMVVNFHEFYGVFGVWDGCPEGQRDPDYLANAIGVAIAAAFVVPAIRADRVKSPHVSFTKDDFMAVVFLVGLALSTWPHCIVAAVGCILSSLVVFSAVLAGARFLVVRRQLRNDLKTGYPELIRANVKNIKTSSTSFVKDHWTPATAWPPAACT